MNLFVLIIFAAILLKSFQMVFDRKNHENVNRSFAVVVLAAITGACFFYLLSSYIKTII